MRNVKIELTRTHGERKGRNIRRPEQFIHAHRCTQCHSNHVYHVNVCIVTKCVSTNRTCIHMQYEYTFIFIYIYSFIPLAHLSSSLISMAIRICDLTSKYKRTTQRRRRRREKKNFTCKDRIKYKRKNLLLQVSRKTCSIASQNVI